MGKPSVKKQPLQGITGKILVSLSEKGQGISFQPPFFGVARNGKTPLSNWPSRPTLFVENPRFLSLKGKIFPLFVWKG